MIHLEDLERTLWLNCMPGHLLHFRIVFMPSAVNQPRLILAVRLLVLSFERVTFVKKRACGMKAAAARGGGL